MNRIDKVFISILTLVVTVLSFAIYTSAKEDAKFKEACIAAGGVPFITSSNKMCFRSSEVINIRN